MEQIAPALNYSFSPFFLQFFFFGLQTWRTRGNKYEHIDNKTDKIYNSMLSDI